MPLTTPDSPAPVSIAVETGGTDIVGVDNAAANSSPRRCCITSRRLFLAWWSGPLMLRTWL
jgi:hypothetical protein